MGGDHKERIQIEHNVLSSKIMPSKGINDYYVFTRHSKISKTCKRKRKCYLLHLETHGVYSLLQQYTIFKSRFERV